MLFVLPANREGSVERKRPQKSAAKFFEEEKCNLVINFSH